MVSSYGPDIIVIANSEAQRLATASVGLFIRSQCEHLLFIIIAASSKHVHVHESQCILYFLDIAFPHPTRSPGTFAGLEWLWHSPWNSFYSQNCYVLHVCAINLPTVQWTCYWWALTSKGTTQLLLLESYLCVYQIKGSEWAARKIVACTLSQVGWGVCVLQLDGYCVHLKIVYTPI